MGWGPGRRERARGSSGRHLEPWEQALPGWGGHGAPWGRPTRSLGPSHPSGAWLAPSAGEMRGVLGRKLSEGHEMVPSEVCLACAG